MNPSRRWLIVGLVLAGGALTTWRWVWKSAPPPLPIEPERKPIVVKSLRPDKVLPLRPPRPDAPLTAAEKNARIEKIKKDYEEMAARFAAEFSAAGTKFPGGLNAYLRQLALLEVEKRKDFAAVLTPRELEDLEMQDTLAGKAVQRWLGDSAATEEQRREVFRVMREFDEKFALTFDLTPTALLVRETARQAMQEQILSLLGQDLAGAWLRGEGPDYASMAALVAQQGLRPESALELWRLKNNLTLRMLEIAAKPDAPAETTAMARTAAVQWARAAATSIIGKGAMESGGAEVLNWIPPKK